MQERSEIAQDREGLEADPTIEDRYHELQEAALDIIAALGLEDEIIDLGNALMKRGAQVVNTGTFQDVLFRRRKELGLTQAELARELGVSRFTLNKLERGRLQNMNGTTARGLLRLGVTVPPGMIRR